MAHTNPLLKTLTIDGDSMDIDAYVGEKATYTTQVNLPANTSVDGAEVTIDETGTYLLIASCQFTAPSTTGAVFRAVRGNLNGNQIFGTSYVDGANTATNKRVVAVQELVAGDKVWASAESQRACNGCKISLTVLKLPSLPPQ